MIDLPCIYILSYITIIKIAYFTQKKTNFAINITVSQELSGYVFNSYFRWSKQPSKKNPGIKYSDIVAVAVATITIPYFMPGFMF